jgi:hypothetical protein
MNELSIFFLYYGSLDTGLNAKHCAQIRATCPDVDLIPLSFATLHVDFKASLEPGLKSGNWNPDSLEDKWNSDRLVWTWCKEHDLDCARYLIVEYDTLITQHPKDFFKSTWNSDAVGSIIIDPYRSEFVCPELWTPQKDWDAFRFNFTPEEQQQHKKYMVGMEPNFGLFSNRAIKAMTAAYFSTDWTRRIHGSSCRLGTLANLSGYRPISFDAESAHTKVSPCISRPNGPGIYHCVK